MKLQVVTELELSVYRLAVLAGQNSDDADIRRNAECLHHVLGDLDRLEKGEPTIIGHAAWEKIFEFAALQYFNPDPTISNRGRALGECLTELAHQHVLAGDE